MRQASTQEHEGTGLGLAIVKALLDKISGRVLVQSIEGVGSCFQIRMPIAYLDDPITPVKSHQSQIPVAGLPAMKNIIVADDNLHNRRILSRYLTTRGYSVKEACSGLEVLDLLDQESEVDLVLMDVQMPEMDGIEATRRIRSRGMSFPDLSIIAVTARVLPGDEEVCRRAGMDGYVAKPFQFEDLLFEISRVARTKAMELLEI